MGYSPKQQLSYANSLLYTSDLQLRGDGASSDAQGKLSGWAGL